MWFVFISCSWHLKVKLTAVLRPVQTPFVRNKNKNLWPHVTVRSRLSVCIDCTVLLHPASTVMIKRWLSTSVTSLSLLLFHLLAFAGLQSRNNFLLKVCIDLSCDGKNTEPPRGGERLWERQGGEGRPPPWDGKWKTMGRFNSGVLVLCVCAFLNTYIAGNRRVDDRKTQNQKNLPSSRENDLKYLFVFIVLKPFQHKNMVLKKEKSIL